jgi:hypothetical protein
LVFSILITKNVRQIKSAYSKKAALPRCRSMLSLSRESLATSLGGWSSLYLQGAEALAQSSAYLRSVAKHMPLNLRWQFQLLRLDIWRANRKGTTTYEDARRLYTSIVIAEELIEEHRIETEQGSLP